MADPTRLPITVRLRPEDKDVFARRAEECGLEPGTAARQIIELTVQRMRDGDADFIDTLQIVKNALRSSQKVDA